MSPSRVLRGSAATDTSDSNKPLASSISTVTCRTAGSAGYEPLTRASVRAPFDRQIIENEHTRKCVFDRILTWIAVDFPDAARVLLVHHSGNRTSLHDQRLGEPGGRKVEVDQLPTITTGYATADDLLSDIGRRVGSVLALLDDPRCWWRETRDQRPLPD